MAYNFIIKFCCREKSIKSVQPGAASPFLSVYKVKHVPLNKMLSISLPSCIEYASFCLPLPPFLHKGHLVSNQSNPDHFNSRRLDATLFIIMKDLSACLISLSLRGALFPVSLISQQVTSDSLINHGFFLVRHDGNSKAALFPSQCQG